MKKILLIGALGGLSAFGGYRAEISPAAARWEVTARDELTNYLARVALDGRVTVEGADGVVFHVGDTDFAKGKGLGSAVLKNEEWVIRSFGRDVVLNGGGTRGCLYAVYHFLEDFCDIRWWYDDDEDVPTAKPLVFPKLDRRGKPYFFYRDIYRNRSTSPVFAMRCRLNGNGNSYIPPEYGGGEIYGPPDHCHTFERYVPWKTYGKEHPEWFSLVGGQRVGGQGRGQLCIANPELRAFFLERVKEAIAKGEAAARAKGLPAPRLYAISPNDNRCYCECERCRKVIGEIGITGYYLEFSNFVANELGPRYPDLFFTFEAYHERSDVPKVAMRAADNVLVRLCNTKQNVASGIFAPENALMCKQMADWGKYAKNLSIWEYAVTYQEKTKGFPYPSEFYIPERYRYYAEKGTVSVLIEHEFPDKSDFYDLKFFLERHALEDPFCDGERLMEEFKTRYFGPAGEKVMASRRYLDKIRRERKAIVSWSPNFSEFGFLKLEDAEYMLRLYDEAEALVRDDPKRLKRVRRARAGLDRYAAAVREASAMHAPEAGVSDVPFYDFPVTRKTWYLYNRANPDLLKFVDEPKAVGKTAVEICGARKGSYYDFPFLFGIEDTLKDAVVYRGLVEAAKPGTGYAWYDFENVAIPSGGYYIFMTRSWAVRVPSMPPIFCGRTFRIRVHMSFEGPLYGRPGDTNRLRIDRLVFVPSGERAAAIPLDGTVYDAYLKTKPGRERKAFLKEAFGGGQFDMRDLFEMVAATKESDWDVRKAARLDRLIRHGLDSAAGPETDCGRRIVAIRERLVEPIKKRHDIIVDGVHAYSAEGYVEPADPAVRAALERFRDRKLGLMMHFGIYAQLGIHESWPLVDKEAGWSRRLVDWQPDAEAFKREYWSMAGSFNPVRFQPEVWAETARRNGFKYLVFTTKHHDGFCLFDSKYSDFKVTSPDCPFSKNPKADIVKATFDAFRAKGLAISCYFSKPDWHHPDYWDNRGLGRFVDRMPTYDVEEHPERWARYREFVRNQLLELTRDYGPLDQLWLDGGQVQKRTGLDIRIEEIVAEARKIQPGLIAVDRGSGNSCENIVTPEQTVPPVPMTVPWESCITMGTGFSYRYDDTYKSPRELVHLLIDVVAKGGNLALNVAPGPDGRLPAPAVARLDAMGRWLKANGAAIYETRVHAPYRADGWAFTRGKDGGPVYAIRLWRESERGVRRLTMPRAFAERASGAVHLATGVRMPVTTATDGSASFELADCVWPDEIADAFRIELGP